MLVVPGGEKPVSAKFGGSLRGERGHRLLKSLNRRGRGSEGARTGDGVWRGVVVLLFVAGDAAQFHRRAEKRHAAHGADRRVGCVAEVLGGEDALGAELDGQAAAYAPDLAGGQTREGFCRIVRHEEHDVGTLLADVVGDLGERLCGREAHAAGNPHPAEDLGAEAAAIGEVVGGGGRWRMDERLVDGILFNVQRLVAENRDNAARHIAVQLVVRGAEVQLARLLAVLELVVGSSHLDAERLELV